MVSPPSFGWTKHGLVWSCYNILFYDIDSLLAVNIIPPPTAVDIRSITGDGTSSSKIVHEDRYRYNLLRPVPNKIYYRIKFTNKFQNWKLHILFSPLFKSFQIL